MKYVLGEPKRKFNLSKKWEAIAGIAIGIIVWDCWFNYGRLTIAILWELSEKIDAII